MRFRFIALLVFLTTFSGAAFAQDTVKLSASFANSDFTLQDLQGVQGELDAKILKSEKFRIGGVFHYVRPCFNCFGAKLDTYSAGPQLSYDVFNARVSLFGRALFGMTTDYNGGNAFTRTYGFGGDVNLGHVFVRPFVMDFVRIEGLPITINRFGAGAGLRF